MSAKDAKVVIILSLEDVMRMIPNVAHIKKMYALDAFLDIFLLKVSVSEIFLIVNYWVETNAENVISDIS